jgi:hypothetical protein
VCAIARQLLRDFRLVEEKFREMARSIQEAQLQPDTHKGTLVAYVLDADADLKSSDQGRSFYTFWEFLMSPSQQDELYRLLRFVSQVASLHPFREEALFLRQLPASLVDAGEKVVFSNSRLAEQLRRVLDAQMLAERRRMQELIMQFKQAALHCVEAMDEDDSFCAIEGSPEVQLSTERVFWEPEEVAQNLQPPQLATLQDEENLDVSCLYRQFFVDEALLRKRIDLFLADWPQVTLDEVIRHYPIEKGLTELLGYCAIATGQPQHMIDPGRQQRIILSWSGLDTQKYVSVPYILYRRSYDEE